MKRKKQDLTEKYQKEDIYLHKFAWHEPNQLSKFKTKKWVEINDVSRGAQNTNA